MKKNIDEKKELTPENFKNILEKAIANLTSTGSYEINNFTPGHLALKFDKTFAELIDWISEQEDDIQKKYDLYIESLKALFLKFTL